MGIAIGNIGATQGYAFAPIAKIDVGHLTQVDVDAALTHPAAADAREIRLATRLQRVAAIHDVVPAVPLRNAIGVHGADKIAEPLRCGDADLLSADAVH